MDTTLVQLLEERQTLRTQLSLALDEVERLELQVTDLLHAAKIAETRVEKKK